MIHIREATAADASAICDIFRACYGRNYPYAQYYDAGLLTKMIYSDDALILVAEDRDAGQLVGTAAVILEVGAYSDLAGEFGRLAVIPAARHQGVGKRLLAARLERVRDKLHVGLIEARVAHPYSLQIAEAHEFAVVGFMPQKLMLKQRESLVLLARYFGSALELRRNNPRIIPEVYPLAQRALSHCQLVTDTIVDEESLAYPDSEGFEVQTLTTDGYASLLRIERGRVRRREIFGPLRLHYGFFKLQSRRSTYLLARDHGQVAGAIGFTLDPVEHVARVFELISVHDHVIRFLLGELLRRCRAEWQVSYIEVDASAHAPRMQRTLLELGFLPAAYVPALVFHEVERLDVVKMVCLPGEPNGQCPVLSPRAQSVADIVLRGFRSRQVLPRIAQAVQEVALFAGLSEEQVNRLAGVCTTRTYASDQLIFAEGKADDEMHLLLEGEVAVWVAGSLPPVGTVKAGECLGEMALLTGAAHSATARARSQVVTAVLGHRDLAELVRFRPDIGLLIYKNLAVGIGKKLQRAGHSPG
jgi:GNAT superfamily N-acetyltransferase